MRAPMAWWASRAARLRPMSGRLRDRHGSCRGERHRVPSAPPRPGPTSRLDRARQSPLHPSRRGAAQPRPLQTVSAPSEPGLPGAWRLPPVGRRRSQPRLSARACLPSRRSRRRSSHAGLRPDRVYGQASKRARQPVAWLPWAPVVESPAPLWRSALAATMQHPGAPPTQLSLSSPAATWPGSTALQARTRTPVLARPLPTLAQRSCRSRRLALWWTPPGRRAPWAVQRLWCRHRRASSGAPPEPVRPSDRRSRLPVAMRRWCAAIVAGWCRRWDRWREGDVCPRTTPVARVDLAKACA